jgi:GT2 family glycosyltransferase
MLASIKSSALVPAVVRVHVNEDPEGAVARELFGTAKDEGVVVRSSPQNLGFARAHNALLSELFADENIGYVLVLNPDVRLEPDALSRLVSFAAQNDKPMLVGPLLALARGDGLDSEGRIDSAGIRWTAAGRHFDMLQNEPIEMSPSVPYAIDAVSGACLLVPRRTFEFIVSRTDEFFDGDFFAYREDAELGLRAAALGVTSWIVPTARANHARTLRGNARGVSAHIDRLGVRNRFLIAFKYGTRRPGGWFGAPLRDVVVLGAVILRERSSWPGIAEAWELRDRMRQKRALMMMSEVGNE